MSSRTLVSSFSKFFQFSKTSSSLRTAPTSVRFLSNNDEQSIESCGKSKTLSKKDKILIEKTPIGKLESQLEGEGSHPFAEKEPLKPFPDGVNPKTATRLETLDSKAPKSSSEKLERISKELREEPRISEEFPGSPSISKELQRTPKNSKGTPKELQSNAKGTPKEP